MRSASRHLDGGLHQPALCGSHQHVVGLADDGRIVAGEQVGDALHALAARLFVAARADNQVARKAGLFERHRRSELRGHAPLRIVGAEPVQPVALDGAVPRITLPGLARLHGVEVAVEQQRRAFAAAQRQPDIAAVHHRHKARRLGKPGIDGHVAQLVAADRLRPHKLCEELNRKMVPGHRQGTIIVPQPDSVKTSSSS